MYNGVTSSLQIYIAYHIRSLIKRVASASYDMKGNTILNNDSTEKLLKIWLGKGNFVCHKVCQKD